MFKRNNWSAAPGFNRWSCLWCRMWHLLVGAVKLKTKMTESNSTPDCDYQPCPRARRMSPTTKPLRLVTRGCKVCDQIDTGPTQRTVSIEWPTTLLSRLPLSRKCSMTITSTLTTKQKLYCTRLGTSLRLSGSARVLFRRQACTGTNTSKRLRVEVTSFCQCSRTSSAQSSHLLTSISPWKKTWKWTTILAFGTTRPE